MTGRKDLLSRFSEPLQHVANRVGYLSARLFPSSPDPSVHTRLAEGVLKIIMEELSGGAYIPDPSAYSRHLRDHRIVRDFNGANAPFLADREGVSISCVWRVLRRDR